MLNVGARVDFGLEAVALIQVEQPNRAQRRDHFRHSLAFLGGTRADTVKYWLGKGGGDPESAVLVWVSHGEFGHGRSPLIFPLTHHGREGCLGTETELAIVRHKVADTEPLPVLLPAVNEGRLQFQSGALFLLCRPTRFNTPTIFRDQHGS